MPPCLKSATDRQHLKRIGIVVIKKDGQLLHYNTRRPIALCYLIDKDSRVKRLFKGFDKIRKLSFQGKEWG